MKYCECGYGCGCQNSCGYPRMRIRMRSSDTPLVNITCEKLKVYIKLPFLGLNSHKMTKDIKTVISKYYPQIQLNIALINSHTLARMFPFKDKIPYLCCSCVIYKYQVKSPTSKGKNIHIANSWHITTRTGALGETQRKQQT